MNIERYKKIVSAIENLGVTEVQELFRLLHKNDCQYTSNNNGIFINLNWVPDDLLDKIEKYIYFCNQSNKEIRRYESLQDILNKKLHEDRDNLRKASTSARSSFSKRTSCTDDPSSKRHPFPASAVSPTEHADKPRVSSSMRFYLLKKRYAKQSPPPPVIKNDINKEPYLLL